MWPLSLPYSYIVENTRRQSRSKVLGALVQTFGGGGP